MAIRPTVPIEIQRKPESRLRVTEIHTIALLRTKGVRFLGVQSTGAGRVTFLFDDTDGRAQALVHAHQDRGVAVNSSDYAAAISWVKDLIFSNRG